jgi:ribosomal protein L37AE/L43A
MAMKVTSGKASRPHHMICPFCESGELVSLGPGFARCGSCRLPLLGSTLETLRDITGLPDALGAHPCECGHPEMRELPGGVFHCPACRSEVLPLEARRSLPGRPAGSMEGYTDFPAGGAGGTVRKRR